MTGLGLARVAALAPPLQQRPRRGRARDRARSCAGSPSCRRRPGARGSRRARGRRGSGPGSSCRARRDTGRRPCARARRSRRSGSGAGGDVAGRSRAIPSRSAASVAPPSDLVPVGHEAQPSSRLVRARALAVVIASRPRRPNRAAPSGRPRRRGYPASSAGRSEIVIGRSLNRRAIDVVLVSGTSCPARRSGAATAGLRGSCGPMIPYRSSSSMTRLARENPSLSLVWSIEVLARWRSSTSSAAGTVISSTPSLRSQANWPPSPPLPSSGSAKARMSSS